ncbi:hypothetical protein [Flavobacterium sp. H122]|uniref:hypothetical protein n=1 Tax=Flavobacterium sp. H122 TaxID=2529860 RepID=UPI0010AAB2BF|nr:hypothetical protein [Flavobacterium sp. H122]
MKYYNSLPEGNEMASMEPVRYFNLGIQQINEIVEWLKTTNEPVQPILVHLEVLLVLSKRYPQSAEDTLYRINLKEIKVVFLEWFERCGSKIPAKYRQEVKENGENIIKELEQYWVP